MAEELLAAVQAYRRTFWSRGGGYWGLFLTSKRVIIANTSPSSRKAIALYFRRWYLVVPLLVIPLYYIGLILSLLLDNPRSKIDNFLIKKFYDLSCLTPENILLADKNNFAIPYHEITTVEFSKSTRWREAKVKINTTTRKQTYYIKQARPEDVNIFRRTLANKIIVLP